MTRSEFKDKRCEVAVYHGEKRDSCAKPAHALMKGPNAYGGYGYICKTHAKVARTLGWLDFSDLSPQQQFVWQPMFCRHEERY